MNRTARLRVAVLGASFAGCFAAAAAATGGAEVIMVERDVLTDAPQARRGVPQGAQPHVLLHRGMLAMEHLLPGLGDDLVAAGARLIDTGHLPWLSSYGWMPDGRSSYDVYSLSRPLLELLVRRRVLALSAVSLRDGTKVSGLARVDRDWVVVLADGSRIAVDVVIDASGRGSRLPHWLVELGYPSPDTEEVDAHLGYASRPYRQRPDSVLPPGVVVLAAPERPRGAMALPVEGDRWLLLENGYGEDRPGRDPAEFRSFLATLPDPVLGQLADRMEPDGDVAVHRQTGNQRRGYARHGRWPPGLLVIGDALCAFNPIYGQGITVAACQAEVLQQAITHLSTARSTRRWQARLAKVTDFPWSVATGEDVRYATAGRRPTTLQRLTGRWTARMSRLAVGGDEPCLRAFGEAYHLMGSPALIFGPAVVASVIWSLVKGYPDPALRPRVLDRLSDSDGAAGAEGVLPVPRV